MSEEAVNEPDAPTDECRMVDEPDDDAERMQGDDEDERRIMDEDDVDPDRVPPLHTRHALRKPNQRQVDEHNVTHLPFAPWCEICIQTRAADHPHRRNRGGADVESMPKVYFDYGFFRSRIGAPLIPFLVGVCGRTGMKFSGVVRDRQARLQSTIAMVQKGLQDLGVFGEVTLRADGESTLLDILRAVAEQRRTRTIVERGPRDDGKANGRAERAIRSVEEITRTLKADLECRIGTAVDPQGGTFEWMLKHGTDLLNKRQPGVDGATPWQRLHGKTYAGELLRFGTSVLHRLSGQVQGGVLVDRWHRGTWLGKTADSDEHVIGVEGGVSSGHAQCAQWMLQLMRNVSEL